MFKKLSFGIFLVFCQLNIVAQSVALSPSNTSFNSISVNDDGTLPNAKLHIKGVGLTPTLTQVSSYIYTSLTAESMPSQTTSSEVFSIYGFAKNSTVQNVGIFGLTGNTGVFNNGVLGMATMNGFGNNYGVRGVSSNLSTGAAFGLFGSAYGNESASALYGVYGEVFSSGVANKYAGYFDGDVGITGTLFLASDFKLKNNLSKITTGLSTVLKLSPYSYKYESVAGMSLPSGYHHGFIAQDVQTVMPELVSKLVQPAKYDEKSKKKISDSFEFLAVNYTEIIPFLVKAIQEQQVQIETLKQEVERLKNK